MAKKGTASKSASGASMSRYDVEVEARLKKLEAGLLDLEVTLSELKTSADTKVDFKGDLNARVDSLVASLKNNKELKHLLQHL